MYFISNLPSSLRRRCIFCDHNALAKFRFKINSIVPLTKKFSFYRWLFLPSFFLSVKFLLYSFCCQTLIFISVPLASVVFNFLLHKILKLILLFLVPKFKVKIQYLFTLTSPVCAADQNFLCLFITPLFSQERIKRNTLRIESIIIVQPLYNLEH